MFKWTKRKAAPCLKVTPQVAGHRVVGMGTHMSSARRVPDGENRTRVAAVPRHVGSRPRPSPGPCPQRRPAHRDFWRQPILDVDANEALGARTSTVVDLTADALVAAHFDDPDFIPASLARTAARASPTS
jgi:hypothetical protein